jgi:hypothetical protein
MVKLFMKYSLPLGVIASSVLIDEIQSFSLSNTQSLAFTASPLHASSPQKYTEDNAAYIMEKARECAYSDTCSLEDATLYLQEVVDVQGNCATGTLSGNEVCDDAVSISEIVTGLRARIEAAKESNKTFNMAKASSEVASGKFPLTPLYIGMAGLYLIVALTANDPSMTTTPFTAQEWWWAARDGYLPDMVHALVRDGGFTVLPSDTDNMPISSVHPFTSQEWWWATRDGYLGDIVPVSLKEGGFSSDGSVDFVPFQGQEWWWAMKDGYMQNMISHGFRNGGL